MSEHVHFKNNFFTINLDKLLLCVIAVYAIYVPFSAKFNTSLPVKEFFIFISILLLVYSIYFSSLTNQLKCIIGFSFIGIELIMFLIPLIYLPIITYYFFTRKKGFKFKKWSVVFIAFFCLSVMQLAISNAGDFSFYTIIFWFIIFGFSSLFFVFYAEKIYTEEITVPIFSFFKKLIQLQIVVLLVQSLIHQKFFPGDEWKGTFLDSDKAGFFLLLLLIFYAVPPLLMNNISYFNLISVKRIIYFSAIVVFLILCDSKIKNVLVLSGIFVLSAFCLLPFVINRSIISYRKAVLFFIIFLFSSGFIFSIMNFYLYYVSKSKTTVQATIGKYTYAPDPSKIRYGVNGKYILYKNIYLDLFYLSPQKWFWGEGPGKFGSRTSNMLGYDVLYKEKDQFKLPEFIPPYSSSMVKKYMRGIWTKEKAQYVRYISSNLSIPVAGWITIKGEMGIIGVIVYFLVIILTAVFLLKRGAGLVSPVLKSWTLVLSVFWMSLPLLMLVDNVQEKPQIMYPMYLLTACILGIVSSHKTV